MTIDQVMYHFEKDLLPSWFYESPKEFLGVLSAEKTALWEISGELFRRAQMETPYRAEDFQTESSEVSEDAMMLSVKFPPPQKEGLCHRAVCFFDKTFTKLAYYTFEKGEDIEGGFPVLCLCDKDGVHYSMGKVSLDKDEQLVDCIEMYLARFFGSGSEDAE